MPEKKDPEETPQESMKLKELHKVWGRLEADIIKSFLESYGISCLLKHNMVQDVYPFTMDGLGEIKIFVTEADFELAKQLLADMPKPEDL